MIGLLVVIGIVIVYGWCEVFYVLCILGFLIVFCIWCWVCEVLFGGVCYV